MNEIVPSPKQSNLQNAAAPMTAAQVVQGAHLIQQILGSVMKERVHYDVLPGCKSKSLLKPGAEKILTTFRISCIPEVEDLSTNDAVRFRVRASGITPDGHTVGVGLGEASSDESKYRWRRAKCDEEWAATPEARRRLDYQKWDGNVNQVKQVRTDISDLANTILKMAKKRALVDLALTATAASDCFTQDLEDLSRELQEMVAEREYGGPPIQQPRPKLVSAAPPPEPAPPAAPKDAREEVADEAKPGRPIGGDTITITGVVEDISTKTGTKKNGQTWTRYGIRIDGAYYNTFDQEFGELAKKQKGQYVTIDYAPDQKNPQYFNILGMTAG